jgi:hypothetical protein
MNLLTASLVLVVVGWLTLVAMTVTGAARARKSALRRLRVVGILGLLGHALLGLVVLGARPREVRYLVDPHAGPEASTFASDARFLLVGLMLLASLVGVVASSLMIAAARHRNEIS